MRGNIRVFFESGIKVKGNVLPFDKFKLNSDIDTQAIDCGMAHIIIRDAEKYLEKPIPYLPLSLHRDFFLTNIRSRYESLAFGRRDMLFYLAMAEIIERKGRFVDKLADIVWAFLEQTEWCIPAHYVHSPDSPKSTVPTVYNELMIPTLELYSGSICGVLSLIAYMLKDELDAISPVIVKRIKYEVYKRGIRPFISAKFSWNGSAGFANNWVTNITQNILLAVALTVEDIETRERVVEIAMNYLDNFTSYYPEDGSCDEGPGYWGAAPLNLFDALEILEDMSGGKINVYNHPLIKKMGEYIVNFNIHGKQYICFADCGPVIEHNGKVLVRYGKKCNSPDLYSFGLYTAANNNDDTYYYAGMGYRILKNLYIQKPENIVRTDAKPAVWYEGNSIAIFRENKDTAKGFLLACKGGSNGEMHNHLDVGCIVVYSNGMPIIIDPSFGSYDNEYFGATRYKRWFTKSSYHSIPSVDSTEQGVGIQFASKNAVCNLEKREVTMDLADAFPKEAGIVKMQRTCALSKGEVTIQDEVVVDHCADIQFNFTLIDKPVKIDDKTFLVTDAKTLKIEADGVTVDVEKIENFTKPIDDLSFRGKWNRECLWRLVIKSKAEKKTVKIIIS